MSTDEVFIICGPQSFYLDDVKVNCIDCGSELFHRPHSPEGTYICLACLFIRSKDQQFHGDFRVTKETAKEVLEEIKMRSRKH